MKGILEKNSGITLIALIVTIVVLIILATISVNLLMNGNIIGRAEQSKEIQKRAEYKERLSLVVDDEYLACIQVKEQLTKEIMKKRLEEDRDNGREPWIKYIDDYEGEEINEENKEIIEVVSKEGYIYHVVIYGDNRYEVIDFGREEKAAPIIKNINVIEKTGSSITINVEVEELGRGRLTYFYSETENGTYTELETSKKRTIAIKKLKPDTIYYIRVKAVNSLGEDEKTINERTLEAPALPENAIQFSYSPTEPTSGAVIVTISTAITLEEQNILEYSRDGVTEWTPYTEGIKYTTNGKVYARITGYAGEKEGAVTNIDDKVPTIQLSKTGDTSGSTSATIKATVDYGIMGVQRVAYLWGDKQLTDFANNKGNTLTSGTKSYSFTVKVNGIYTVYIEGKNGKKAKNTIKIENLPNEITFNYTGRVQSFVVPETGKYKIEVWGAQGGYGQSGGSTKEGEPGKGGYSAGVITLNKGITLYIHVRRN